MNRQKQILLVLLIVLALTSMYAYLSSPQPGEIALVNESEPVAVRNNSIKAESAIEDSGLQVNLELLDFDKKKYRGYKRDIFNFYQPKPVVVPQIKKPKPIEKIIPVAKPKPVVTPQVRKQLASFTFLGFLLKDEERTVFLSKRDKLFLVKKRDFFGENDQFEVADVTEEKLTITQKGVSGLIEIPLFEKEPLIPSFSPGEATGSNEAPSVNETSVTAPNRSGVPLQEQRKRWFKTTQPPVKE